MGIGMCILCHVLHVRISDLERAEHGAHVARRVVVHHGEHDGVHERNHVLGAVGGDAQQHVGAEHVKKEDNVEQTGEIGHGE
jgi:hypothetical protein